MPTRLVTEQHSLLEGLFRTACEAASPALVLSPHLPPAPKGRTVAVGAGKAAAAMAQAVEADWTGPLSGLVVTRRGQALPCRRIEVVEAAHPVPDLSATEAARRILAAVHGLTPDDLVLCLISGDRKSVV